MAQQYSQLRAMLAITKGALIAIFRSPAAVAFSFGFPLVFILVFGFINGGAPTVTFALTNQRDSVSPVIRGLLRNPTIKLSEDRDSATDRKDLQKGRIAAIVALDSARSPSGLTEYTVRLQTSNASADKYPIFKEGLAQVFEESVEKYNVNQYRPIIVDELPVLPGRQYSMIDFILPGMLGFSLLSAAVFGVAFLFFSLRQQLVLKRFYSTPISKTYIVLGEGLARVLFQLITAIVILVLGWTAFHFTMVNGWVTFWEMLFLSLFGLIVFMGCGFIISSVAKNESVIPIFANVITLPQFLLSGTFFTIDVFPGWLQPICRWLPLTQLNDAMRKVSFEGAHLADCGKELGILVIWGIVIYAVAIKVFKWE